MAEHRAETAQRRAQALELHRAGVRDAEIADRLGYRNPAAATRDVERALTGVVGEPTAEVIAEEVDRLDALLSGLWPKARRGDVAAVDRVLRIMDRRARYLGLNGGLTDRNIPRGPSA